MTPNLPIAIDFKTDIGMQRSANEDTAAVFDLSNAQSAFVVCDGMGGLRSGDIASGETARTVEAFLNAELAANPQTDPAALLANSLKRANDAVLALNADFQRNADGTQADIPAGALMGTTCVAGIVKDNTLYIAHAGDSRAYLWRGGELVRLTQDHSFVAERVRAGDITEDEARVSRYRNMITRAIGIAPTVDPELHRESLRSGDGVLVCSDGLTTMLDDDEIVDILRSPSFYGATPHRIVGELVDAANRKGGHDNVTVLFLRAGEVSDEQLPPPVSKIALVSPEPISTSVPIRASGEREGLTVSRSRGRSKSPIEMLVLGVVLGLIGAYTIFSVVPGLRSHAGAILHDTPALSGTGQPDYTNLKYGTPQHFSDMLARGDVLTVSRSGFVFFARGSTGDIVSLPPSGTPTHTLPISLDIASVVSNIAPGEVFVASDPAGDLYVSNTKQRTIQKYGPDGAPLQTLKGFDRPEAIALNEAGDIFVIDANSIKVIRAHPGTAK